MEQRKKLQIRNYHPSAQNHRESFAVRTDLVVIRQEEVAVHLVDEHLEEDVRVVPVRTRDSVVQSRQSLRIRLVLRVNDEHNGAAVAEDHLLVHKLSAVDQVLCQQAAATSVADSTGRQMIFFLTASSVCTFKVVVSWKVPDLELHERVVGDVLDVETVGAFQEQRLVWRHLVENHPLDARLTTPAFARRAPNC